MSTPPVSPTFFVIGRHGETEANALKIISGSGSNHQLTEKGKAHAVRLGKYFIQKHPEITNFYSSDLDRAHETAKLAFAAYGNVDIKPRRKLREIRHGSKEGTSSKERDEAWTAYTQNYLKNTEKGERDPLYKWISTPFHKDGAETVNHLYIRAVKKLITLAKRHPGEKIGIITHGALMKTLIMRSQMISGALCPDKDRLYPLFFETLTQPYGTIAVFKCNPEDESADDLALMYVDQLSSGED